jgi:hypothetical protein
MRLFVLIMLVAWAPAVFSTAQLPDLLLLDGEELKLHTQPISPLLESDPKLRGRLLEHGNQIRTVCSASWIGLRATWTISDGELFLVKLVSNPCSSSPTNIPLSKISGKRNAPVFASWFSGELIVPQGKLVEHVHMGFASRYERYLVINVEEGRVLRHELRETTIPEN